MGLVRATETVVTYSTSPDLEIDLRDRSWATALTNPRPTRGAAYRRSAKLHAFKGAFKGRHLAALERLKPEIAPPNCCRRCPGKGRHQGRGPPTHRMGEILPLITPRLRRCLARTRRMARVAGTKGFMLESRTCAVALAAIARELVVETSSMAAGRSKIFPSENMPEVELGWPPPRSSGAIKPGVPTAGPATDAAVPCTTPRVNSRTATCGAPQWPKRMFSSAHVLAPARTSTRRPRARPPAWTKSV